MIPRRGDRRLLPKRCSCDLCGKGTKLVPSYSPPSAAIEKRPETKLKTSRDSKTGDLLVEVYGHNYPIDSTATFDDDNEAFPAGSSINPGITTSAEIPITSPAISCMGQFSCKNPCIRTCAEQTSVSCTSSVSTLSGNFSSQNIQEYTWKESCYKSAPRVHTSLVPGGKESNCHETSTNEITDASTSGKLPIHCTSTKVMQYSSPVPNLAVPVIQLAIPMSQRAIQSSTKLPLTFDRDISTNVNSNVKQAVSLSYQLLEQPVRRGYHHKKPRKGCRLWEFIRNLLLDPACNPSIICWENREEGAFRLVQPQTIAYIWGAKKGNKDMTYGKMSRAMRYYYKRKIFEPVFGKRLVYKFGPRAVGWK